MYTILSMEIEDPTVMQAINTLVRTTANEGGVPHASGNYVLISNDALRARRVEGNGGTGTRSLFIVGHGSPNGLSGSATWTIYRNRLPQGTVLEAPDRIYIISCGVAGPGNLFAYGNFANSLRAAYPNIPIWASANNVNAGTLAGLGQI